MGSRLGPSYLLPSDGAEPMVRVETLVVGRLVEPQLIEPYPRRLAVKVLARASGA